LSYAALKTNLMASYRYKITVKTSRGFIIAGYKSQQKLEAGEEIFLFYDGKTNLVKITVADKGKSGSASAEEI
jgi:hypothetical protein